MKRKKEKAGKAGRIPSAGTEPAPDERTPGLFDDAQEAEMARNSGEALAAAARNSGEALAAAARRKHPASGGRKSIKRWAKPVLDRYQGELLGPTLDEEVPKNNPVRLLDAALAQLDWTAWEAKYKSTLGRPPLHPRLMAAAICYGLMRNQGSCRDLEYLTQCDIAVRWLLDRRNVDHSTFAKFMLRFKDEVEALVGDLAGLVRRHLEQSVSEMAVAMDGTVLRANSNRHGSRSAASIEKQLAELDMELANLETRLAALQNSAAVECEELERECAGLDREQLEQRLAKQRKLRDKLQGVLETAKKRDAAKLREEGRNAAPVRVPVNDPDATCLPNKEGGCAPNYTATSTVDDNGMINHADVVEGNDEAAELQNAVAAIEEQTGETPAAILGDSHFATGANLDYAAEKDIDVFAPAKQGAAKPAPESTERTVQAFLDKGRRLKREDFHYDGETDTYTCPAGRTLATRSKPSSLKRIYSTDCTDCPLRGLCIKGRNKHRTVYRDRYQHRRDELAARMAREGAREIYQRRAALAEGVFAVIKNVMNRRRFHRTGRTNVKAEWHWICAAYNLLRLLGILRDQLLPTGGDNPEKRHGHPCCSASSRAIGALAPQILFRPPPTAPAVMAA